ncbi:MAG: hypothetical protein NTX31_10115 [Burkholderiales bacterium]|nr:hypothetical protein [Burkholderiales bacterium]
MSFPSIMMCAKEHTAIPNVQFVIPNVQFAIPNVPFVIPDLIRDPVPRAPWIAGRGPQ